MQARFGQAGIDRDNFMDPTLHEFSIAYFKQATDDTLKNYLLLINIFPVLYLTVSGMISWLAPRVHEGLAHFLLHTGLRFIGLAIIYLLAFHLLLLLLTNIY